MPSPIRGMFILIYRRIFVMQIAKKLFNVSIIAMSSIIVKMPGRLLHTDVSRFQYIRYYSLLLPLKRASNSAFFGIRPIEVQFYNFSPGGKS